MNLDEHEIDKLLQSRVRHLLSDFDWDGLNQGITRQLHACERRRHPARLRLAVAAAILVAGAVIAVGVRWRHSARESSPSIEYAKVSLSAPAAGKAVVALVMSVREAKGKCELLPAAPRTPSVSQPSRPSWCIVAGQESSTGDTNKENSLETIMHLL